MQTTTVTEVKALLNRLPEESNIEDIQYHLYVIAKIQKGLDRVDSEAGIEHQDVEKRFEKWLVAGRLG